MTRTAANETWLAGTTELYADLPGLRMHYMTAGNSSGKPIVLLHGFPECWYSWRFQMEALAKFGYYVIVPDQRGYNLSSKAGPFDVRTLVSDIAHFQKYLGIDRCIVVGHDWGAAVAWSFAGAYPERVDCLVTMNGPHPRAYLDARRAYPMQLLRSWYMFFFQIPALPEVCLSAYGYRSLVSLFRTVPKAQMTEDDIERYKNAWSQPGALTASIGWYRALPSQRAHAKSAEVRRRLVVPSMVIWGEDDFCLEKGCNDTLPNYVSDLTIEYVAGGGHWVQMVCPDAVNKLLLKFIA